MKYPRIKELRELLNFKQDYLAAELHLEQPEYSRLENGRRNPKTDELKILGGIYGVSVDYILEGAVHEMEPTPKNRDAVPTEIIERLMLQNEKLMNDLIKGREDQSDIIKHLLKKGGAKEPE